MGAPGRDVRREFDRAFFRRYYKTGSTAVISSDEVERRARFVLAYLAHLRIGVRSVLDAGCGTGMWKRALHRLDRSISYTGIEGSEYLCQRYGWIHGSIADFATRRRYDLVVCQDVMQYVDARDVERAIEVMARACRGALYFDVPTRDDIEDGLLDLRRTDRRIHVRSALWYRRRLRKHFVSAGGGVFLPRDSRTVLLALERGR
jgi:SAM-dependent methyltransferase